MLPDGISKEDIVARECRFATYAKAEDGLNDMVVAKEYLYLKDGSRVPNIALYENFERPFYVTQKAHRNHYENLEWEDLDKVQLFMSTEAQIAERAAKAVGIYARRLTKKTVAVSPYVYGYDISTTAIIKQKYKEQYPDHVHPSSSVAALDIETNVNSEEKEILMVGFSFRDKVYVAVNKTWLEDTPSNRDAIHYKFKDLLGRFIEERNLTLEVDFCATPGMCCVSAIAKAHIWKPDYISIWNMDFDLPKMIKTMRSEGIDVGQVLSDPLVPDRYKFSNYKSSNPQKRTQSGKMSAKHPADMWHTCHCPASFYFLDSMCIYKRIRAAAGMVSSYGLDAALARHLNLGKLKFTETDHLARTEWHSEMQKNYRIEYVIYNIFDCVGLEILDEKINDLGRSFDALSGVSDYSNFDSTPTRIADDLHFYVQKFNKVIGTAPGRQDIIHPYDDKVIGIGGWVSTLPSFMMDDNGCAVIKEMPDVNSMMRAHCGDIDIEGTYPNGEDIMNISKETTYRELCQIQGLTEADRRIIGINLSGGVSNAVEICNKALQLPALAELGDIYMKHRDINDVTYMRTVK